MRQDRKDSHIQICLEDQVDYSRKSLTGFSSLRFNHDALPEVSKSAINLETTIFGKKLSAPIFVGAMTGGTPKSALINQRLAEAASQCGVGMALGSQRKMLEDRETKASFAVKEKAPKLPLLLGNIGAVQLNYGVKLEDILYLISETHCDGFIFHLNPLQEAIQPEGQTDFSNLLVKLQEVISDIKIPVIIKEVGAGISQATARKIKTLPVQGIETAGVGGTSWAKIESIRTSDQLQKSTGEVFAKWGIPTVESILACRAECPDLTILASGGIRGGIEVAKSIALGADAVGMALPFLKAAEKSINDVVDVIEKVMDQLRTVMFLTGCKDIEALKKAKLTKSFDPTVLETWPDEA